MRVTSLVAGLAVALAACSGGDKGAATTADTTASATTTPAPATAGATHDVDMVMESPTAYRFVPAELTVKAGDVIRFHNKSGGPHNVAFWSDSIPSGAEAAIQIADQMAPLTSNMVTEQDGVITVTMGATAPTGDYRYTCQPHSPMGMHGKITVQ